MQEQYAEISNRKKKYEQELVDMILESGKTKDEALNKLLCEIDEDD